MQRRVGLRLIYLLDNSSSFNAQGTFSFITLKLKGNTFPVIAWLVRNAFIKTQSLSYSGIIRRKDINSGREYEGERVAAGTVAPNRPDFQVLCPSLLTALSLKVEGTTYCVGSGGNLETQTCSGWSKSTLLASVWLDLLS